jgi:hypothetical protein
MTATQEQDKAQANAQGQRHRERMSARSRLQSRAAREIAPMPAIKNPPRRIAARKDLRYFCTNYFPKKFKLRFSSYHEEVIKHLQTGLVQGKTKIALAMPRGSGKTTLVQTAVIWAILFGHCRYILIIGANKPESKKIIDNIKADLIGNKALLEDFPESIYPFVKLGGSALQARGQLYLGELTNVQWKPDTVVFPDIPGSPAAGAAIVTVGITGGIRGKNRTMPNGEIARPDMTVLDDVQTDADARSPLRVARLEELINRAVAGLVGPGQDMGMVMTCTVIQQGDLADRYLNHKIYPEWHGMRYKMVETMPSRMDLWDEYWEVCRKQDRIAGTQFYKRHRTEMDKDAVVAWEDNFVEGKQISALQYAMDKYYENPDSFQSEYQNEPQEKSAETIIVPAKTIRTRLNGMERRVIPMDSHRITAFCDVHDDLIYYMVCSWADDFTGCVIDYDVFPEQQRINFSRKDRSLNTLAKEYGGLRREGSIAAGLEALLLQLLSECYTMFGDREEQEVNRIDRILIDSGYKPHVVESVITKIGSPSHIRPSLGVGVGAKQTPMQHWKGKSVRAGHYWIEEKMPKRIYKTTKGDVNYWKSAVHDAFSLRSSERGGISFWGSNPEAHRMVSEHITAEKVVLVEANARKVNEWSNPFQQDNHWFDCLVGCMIGASTLGIRTAEERETTVKTPTRVIDLT